MTNPYYVSSGTPGTGAPGASAPMRGQFSAIEDAFDLLPALTAGTAVVVNPGGTALTITTGTLALAGNFATTGAYNVTLVAGATVSINLPIVTGLTLATLTGTETLSNKTLGSGTHLGTPLDGDASNLTGTAAGLSVGYAATAGSAPAANLTGPITSVGAATAIASQTGTGTKFVVDDTPTLITPILGVATATSLAINGATIGSNALAVTGTATISTSLAIAGATIGSNALAVTGTVAISSTASIIGAVTLGTQQTTQGSLVLANTAAGAFALTLKSSNSATQAYTLTLPPDDGTSGYVLQTDGSGTTTWAASSSSGSGGTTASGSVTLTSASSGAQAITTTAFGQYVKLPDATTMTKASNNFNVENLGGYPLKVLNNSSSILGYIYPGDSSMIGCADSSTAAGVWTCTNLEPLAITARFLSTSIYNLGSGLKIVAVDSDRTLLLCGTGTANLYGVMYTASTTTWGTPVLIRSSASNCMGIKTATDQVLVASCNGTTGFEAVVLSLSGNTITVNTAATATNAANITNTGFRGFVACGSTYIVGYSASTPNNTMRAMTISGTTVTIGSESTTTGTDTVYFYMAGVSATVFLTISFTASTGVYAKPFSISGTTISAGTEASVTGLTSTTDIRIYTISSGVRWVMLYLNAAGTSVAASIISVAGSVATLSTVNLIASTTNVFSDVVGIADSSKLICISGAAALANILTDTGGTASAGTSIAVGLNSSKTYIGYYASGNVARFLVTAANDSKILTLGYSGSSPTYTDSMVFSTTAGFAGQTNAPPFDGSRAPAAFIGTRTLSAQQFTGATTNGMRIPIATGSVLQAQILKFYSEVSLTNANLNIAVGQNGTWMYGPTTLNPYGLSFLIEGVT